MGLTSASRREFLRRAGALSAVGAAGGPFAFNLATLGAAAAQTAPTDYKALVCVFLLGGNDSFNTVLATDPDSWSAYNAVRQGPGDAIALLPPGAPGDPAAAPESPARLGGVLALAPQRSAVGRGLSLHPMLGTLQSMFNVERRMGIVANVGPLVVPTSKAQYRLARHPRPAKLYSHNDQQSAWQAFAPEGATLGWGGRMADLLLSQNDWGSLFTAVSASGSAVWLAGREVRQYQVSPSGPIRMALDASHRLLGSAEAGAALQRIVTTPRSMNLLQRAYADTSKRSIEAERVLGAALATVEGSPAFGSDADMHYIHPLTGAATRNTLAQQLRIVAKMIAAARGLGVKRQLFFVSFGSFDTHDFQNRNHTDLMARLAHGLRYFDTVLGRLGAQDKVTTFTASDFGRMFTSNGDGTDHGWGAHQFVMGGAVQGGDVYGTFPTYGLRNAAGNDFSSPDQVEGNGSLLPSVSVDQYAATLGRWFGLSEQQLLDVLPNLRNFTQRDLGFMRL